MKTLKEIIDSVFTSGQEFQAKQELGQRWADGKKNEALQAIKEILEGVVAEVAKKPAISPRVGAFVGKSITNSGPTAQARIDGFNCALSEIRANAAKVLGE